MGLSERKTKQRVGSDPRNLAWSDNAARFGHKYLANLGWSPSMGLGASGDGRTTHIAVAHKLDQLGIGANPAQGPDAIAWKQNKDFEGLLDRLNKTKTSTPGTPAGDSTVEIEAPDNNKAGPSGGSSEGEQPVERKKRKKAKKDFQSATPSSVPSDADVPSVEIGSLAVKGDPDRVVKPRRMAHRARFHASKRMAASSPAALSEILGISASSSARATPTPTPTPSSTLTPIYDTPPADDKNVIHTSSVNIADYFKQKMLGKSFSSLASKQAPAVPADRDEDEERPRMGLGSVNKTPVTASTHSYSAIESSEPINTGASLSHNATPGDSTTSPDPPLLEDESTPPLEDIQTVPSDKPPKKQRKAKPVVDLADTSPTTLEEPPRKNEDRPKRSRNRKSQKRERKERIALNDDPSPHPAT